jgi:hypothetical protein
MFPLGGILKSGLAVGVVLVMALAILDESEMKDAFIRGRFPHPSTVRVRCQVESRERDNKKTTLGSEPGWEDL